MQDKQAQLTNRQADRQRTLITTQTRHQTHAMIKETNLKGEEAHRCR